MSSMLVRNHFGSPGPMTESQRVSSLPSWWEFVQHLIHTPAYRYMCVDNLNVPMTMTRYVDILNVPMARYDGHWRPYTMFCSVCFIPYNYILHFENIQEEQKMIAIDLNATSILKPRYLLIIMLKKNFAFTSLI